MFKIYSRYRLVRRIVNLQKFIPQVKPGNETIAFKENPSPGKFDTPVKEQITAADLFSMFTADIILANKRFVR